MTGFNIPTYFVRSIVRNVQRTMLRTFFLSAIMLFALAPELTAQLSGIGIGGGGTLSKFESTQVMTDNKLGGTAGIRLDFNLGDGDAIKLSPEIFIIQSGSQITEFSSLEANAELDYVGLNVPFTLYVGMDSDGIDSYDVYNGLMIQARLFADYVINETEIDLSQTIDGFDFGGGVDASFLYNGLRIGVGYQYGLKESAGEVANSLINFRNRGLTLQIGYIGKLE